MIRRVCFGKSLRVAVQKSYNHSNTRRRWLQSATDTSAASFSRRLYPLAQEAPEITATQATETESESKSPPEISTKLSNGNLPIEPTVPSHIPPNLTIEETPTPQLTELSNGIRIVSQETFGQITTLGIVQQLGSLYEQKTEMGASVLLETMGLPASPQLQLHQRVNDWGGTLLQHVGREQALFGMDLLRPHATDAVELLATAIRQAHFQDDDIVQDALRTLEFIAMELPPDVQLQEVLYAAAFHNDSNMGKPHYPVLGQSYQHLNAPVVTQFWQRLVLDNPAGMVVGAAGIEHERLVEAVQTHWGDIPANNRIPVPEATYQGGQRLQIRPFDESLEELDLVRLGIFLPCGGWHDDDVVTACVLQTLLGGGQSFSAGGPGKGMYSRLYTQVLNQYRWAEACLAQTHFCESVGLWGITASAPPQQARDMAIVCCHHLIQAANVSEVELDRARKMLQSNVLTQLESRLVLFEDLSRQVLTYGKYESMESVCAKIQGVTLEDIERFVLKSLESPPAVAALGSDLQYMPSREEINSWLSSGRR